MGIADLLKERWATTPQPTSCHEPTSLCRLASLPGWRRSPWPVEVASARHPSTPHLIKFKWATLANLTAVRCSLIILGERDPFTSHGGQGEFRIFQWELGPPEDTRVLHFPRAPRSVSPFAQKRLAHLLESSIFRYGDFRAPATNQKGQSRESKTTC